MHIESAKLKRPMMPSANKRAEQWEAHATDEWAYSLKRPFAKPCAASARVEHACSPHLAIPPQRTCHSGCRGSRRHGSTPNRHNLETAQYPPAGTWAEGTALRTKQMNDSDIQQNASIHPQYWVKKAPAQYSPVPTQLSGHPCQKSVSHEFKV